MDRLEPLLEKLQEVENSGDVTTEEGRLLLALIRDVVVALLRERRDGAE